METSEKIVEAYVRYVKRWATISNIRCGGQFEIDLIAIDPVSGERYHIESGISISSGFKNLTAKPFDPEKLKLRKQQAQQRRTLGYFAKRKFGAPGVLKTLKDYGFKKGNYTRVIVTWGCQDGVEKSAKRKRIDIWKLPDLMSEIAAQFEGKRAYFIDDTLRTLHLYENALAENKKRGNKRKG